MTPQQVCEALTRYNAIKQAYDLYMISGNPDLFVEQVVEVMRG
ncbi:hypothetical protein [Salinicoccus roseus]|nr:hypothetical protein [Salinicoccus roseus]